MPGAIYSKQGRALGVGQDSPDSSCSSSVSALLRRPSTSSCWHWTRPQRHRCQRNCLRMKRNQTDWRVAQAAVYHRICLPCRSARRELAPGSANQTLVSGSAPCCCARPHQSLLPSPVVADRETMRVGKKRKAPVINKGRGGDDGKYLAPAQPACHCHCQPATDTARLSERPKTHPPPRTTDHEG